MLDTILYLPFPVTVGQLVQAFGLAAVLLAVFGLMLFLRPGLAIVFQRMTRDGLANGSVG